MNAPTTISRIMPVVRALDRKQVCSTRPVQLALHQHQQERHREAERGGLGRRRDAEIEAAHHGAEHRERLDQVAQHPDALATRHLDRRDLLLAQFRRDVDVQP